MSARASTFILVAAAMVAAVSTAPAGRSTDLAVAGRGSANASIASAGRFVAVAWGATAKDGTTDVYAAVSRDSGRTFRDPVRVSGDRSRADLSGEQPARVTLVPRAGRDPAIVVVWTAKTPAGTRLLSARSEDGGASYAPGALVPGSDAAGNRGWESIATDGDGRVVAVWLDHRAAARTAAPARSSGSEHQHAGHGSGDGAARAQLSKIVFARLERPDSLREIASGVCYCCKTAVATGPDGSIWAAWRHVYSGNVRDIAFTVSRDGGRTFAPPTRVSDDRWVLDGCPENGPALAVDPRGRVHVVWPTLVAGSTPGTQPTLALFHAVTADGRRFSPRQRIPVQGFPRHPQIAIGTDGAVVVAWDEQAARGGRRVALGRGIPDERGAIRFSRHAVDGTGSAAYPAVTATDDGIVLVWTGGATGQTTLRVERIAN
jgi:hypothetical protein